MTKYDNVGVELRETSRQELKHQVDRFLAQGGTIQKIPNSDHRFKPVAKAWGVRAQGFEHR